jgi:hypothetical protein
MMDDFEKQLKDAFHRKEPSADFELRVLAAAREKQHRRSWLDLGLALWMPGRLRWGVALAMSVALVAIVVEKREASERAAGEAAKARLELALKITSTKLNKIREQVNAGIQDE